MGEEREGERGGRGEERWWNRRVRTPETRRFGRVIGVRGRGGGANIRHIGHAHMGMFYMS